MNNINCKTSVYSTVFSWMWDGCTDAGNCLPDQPHHQPSSGGVWQRAARRFSGLQQRPLWESHRVVHRPLEPGMRMTEGPTGLKGKLSGVAKCMGFYSDFTLTYFFFLSQLLNCVIESIWSQCYGCMWPSALQSVAQEASIGQWCVW